MAKIALICDTHAGVRNDSQTFLTYQEKSFSWFFDILDKENIKHIIHLGDLMDRRKYLNYLTLQSCRRSFLDPIKERGLHTHIICGNHDHFYKNTHSVNSLKEIVDGRYDNIRTYDTPEVIEIDGLKIQLLPWITESNRKESTLAIENSPADFLMGHLEVTGFEVHKGIEFEHGTMKPQDFKKFDMVFSGHFHHASKRGNIQYLGAFSEFTWSDYNDPRGFHIFDTETRDLKFYKNPFQIFRMYLYNDCEPNYLENMKLHDFSIYKDSYVKMVIQNRTNPFAFDLTLDEMYKAGPSDISIIENTTSFTDDMEDESIDETEDTPTILSKYIDGLTLPVDTSKMKKYIQKIYDEALRLERI